IFAKVVGAVEQVAGIPPLERARFEVMNERIHAQGRHIRITPQIVDPVEDPGRLDRVEPRTRSGDAEPLPEAPDGPHDSTNWRLLAQHTLVGVATENGFDLAGQLECPSVPGEYLEVSPQVGGRVDLGCLDDRLVTDQRVRQA